MGGTEITTPVVPMIQIPQVTRTDHPTTPTTQLVAPTDNASNPPTNSPMHRPVATGIRRKTPSQKRKPFSLWGGKSHCGGHLGSSILKKALHMGMFCVVCVCNGCLGCQRRWACSCSRCIWMITASGLATCPAASMRSRRRLYSARQLVRWYWGMTRRRAMGWWCLATTVVRGAIGAVGVGGGACVLTAR